MLTDENMKFREDSLNSLQVIERTPFCDRAKGNNSRRINARVMVIVFCTLSNVD